MEQDSLLRLHRLVGRLFESSDLSSALDEVLVAAMELTGAEMGNVQLVAEDGAVLEIVAHRGFDREFLEHFRRVSIADDDTAYGRAARTGKRVIVENERTEPSFRPHLEITERAGDRALQTTPLIGRDGRLLGALSTHYSRPFRPSEHELRMLDLYAQQAVHVMERHRAEGILREEEARKSFLLDLNDALRTLEDPDRIQAKASRVLREHLGGSRVVYWEARSEDEMTPVGADYAPDAVRLSGTFRISDYGTSLLSELLMGHAITQSDPAGDPRLTEAQRTAFGEAGSGAWAGIPLVKEGRLVAVLSASFPHAHDWSEAEVTLMEEVAERTWAAVERARAEQALRESEERFRTLFQTMDDGFVIAELVRDEAGRAVDFRWLEVNAAVERRTGRPRKAWIGRRATEVLPDLEPLWFERFQRAVDTGRPQRFEAYATPFHRWYDVTAFPYGSDWFAAIYNDITERRQAEAALREAKHSAEAANEAKSRFLALMSHELRTPLSSVLGCVRLLEDDVMGTLGPEQRDLVSRIRKSAAFQSDMIEEILSIIRLDAGKEPVRWEAVDVAEVVREVAAFFEPDAADRGLRLRVAVPDAPEDAHTDRAKVRQILMNLIGNAIKYTGHGEVAVALQAGGPEALEVHVHDTGRGIRPEDQEAVFEPFHQLDDSLTRAASGTGLGLSISRSLARLIGGDLTLRSVPGEGSTFILHVPRRGP